MSWKLNVWVLSVALAPSDAVPKYNAYTGQWEMASPNATLQYDSANGTWHYLSTEG